MRNIFDVGTKCGEWTIRKYLDGAGQSEIYIADRLDLRGHKLVAAIRTIKFDKLQSREHLLQVQNAYALEYEVLSKFHSEYIAKVYDYGVSPHFWIATEFIKGESLANRLERGPLTKDEWHSVAQDAIRGLMHAHDRKVIHQDVKPGNIMIRDVDHRALWIDFGSASILGKSDPGYNGAAKTLSYVAPERMDGSKRGNPATDLYSLGVMLYEAALGKSPWVIPSKLSFQEYLGHLYNLKMELRVDLSELDSSQAKLVKSLLSPDPKRRPTAQQALKLIGTNESEMHGGTIMSNVENRKPSPAAPAGLKRKPKMAAKSKPIAAKTPVAQQSSPAKPVDKVRRTSLLLLIFTAGLFHPIATWTWYSREKSKKYLLLAWIGTGLSSMYFIGSTLLPKDIDSKTGAATVQQQYSGPLLLVAMALLAVSIYAHLNRPRPTPVER